MREREREIEREKETLRERELYNMVALFLFLTGLEGAFGLGTFKLSSLKEVICSRHISLQNIHFNKS